MKMSDVKQEQIPALFGESARPSEVIKDKKSLLNEGGNFDGGTAMKGDKWDFPEFDEMLIRKQVTRAGGNNYGFFVLATCTSGGKSQLKWFNIGSLARQDANRVAVMPEWYELGNVYARAQKLAGRIIDIKEEKPVEMPKFEDGVRVEGATVTRNIAIVPFN
jgi:hypothetical protein